MDFGITYDLSNLIKFGENNDFIYEDRQKIRAAIRTFIDKLISCYNEYLDKDLLLRGGVSFGKIISHQNTIVGIPVTEAVRLESKGIAPVILVPARVLDSLGLSGWPNLLDIPLKNNRIISAAAIVPSDSNKFIQQLKIRRRDEIYKMTKYSGVLDRAFKISKTILISYNFIQEHGE